MVDSAYAAAEAGHGKRDGIHVNQAGKETRRVYARTAEIDLHGAGKKEDEGKKRSELEGEPQLERVVKRDIVAVVGLLAAVQEKAADESHNNEPMTGGRMGLTRDILSTATTASTRTNMTVHATVMASANGFARSARSWLLAVKLAVTAVLDAMPPRRPVRPIPFFAPATLIST